MPDATATTARPTRTTGDLVLGGLLVLVSVGLFGHVALATAVSVLFTGWTLLLAGVVTLGFSLFGGGREAIWTGLLAGGLLTVLGLVMVRNPELAALSLTLIAATTFLASGVVRLAAASQQSEGRVALLIGGGVSTLLGLVVLLNLVDASFTLLGVMLAVQVLAEGLALMIVGRPRGIRVGTDAPAT